MTAVAIDVGPTVGRRTGIGQFVVRLVDALTALPEPPALQRYVLSFRAALPDGVRRLPYPAGLTLRAWGRFDRPRARWALGSVGVVHGTNYVVPPSGLPTIVTVHDCSFVTRPELVNDVVRRFVPVVRRAVARGAWVHTPSEYVGGEVQSLFGVPADRLRVIPHGAPPPPASVPGAAEVPAGPLPGDGRPYVLALGTREPRKNLPRLVDAYGLVRAEHRDVALVLVGPEGPDQPNVRAAIDRLPPGAARDVTVTDWVSDEHRAELLAGADVLAVPSLDEGFSLPLLEAMQAGVPIVAARAGAIPEVAADAALLVDPHDTSALAAAVLTAVTDSVTRSRLVAAGHARVGDFTWERTAAAFAALYREAAMEPVRS